jgi:predicted nucleic-acid-binding Zn-ribbon protein
VRRREEREDHPDAPGSGPASFLPYFVLQKALKRPLMPLIFQSACEGKRMDWLEKTVADYRCPKCRNSGVITRRVNLATGILPELLTRGGGKYIFLTCSLCGYTEIYDLALYARNQEARPAESESIRLAPGT